MILLFVYNADSGLIPIIRDVGHKIISPKTYPCSLCALTYNTFTENKRWKSFRKSASTEFEFLHKDEFETQFPEAKFNLPVVIKNENSKLTEILSAHQLDAIEDVEELIDMLKCFI